MPSNTKSPASPTTKPYGGVHLRSRRGGQSLQLDLFSDGQRYRKDTGLADTAANRQLLQPAVQQLEAARTLGLLDSSGELFTHALACAGVVPSQPRHERPALIRSFSDCAEGWISRSTPQWRDSTVVAIRDIVTTHLVPAFGQDQVPRIGREQLLDFRARLASERLANGQRRSPRTVNIVFSVLVAILAEECTRLGIPSPASGIKRLKVRKPDIFPFRLEQVQQLVQGIDPRWSDYILVWAFTGMRTAEMNGLQWCRVHLDSAVLQIRETWSKGKSGTTKSEAGLRDIRLTRPVIEALRRQQAVTGGGRHVFTSVNSSRVDARNFARRVWHPLLRQLGLATRRPYQLRHTYATQMLAAGENPEFVARQLGHADTTMLFEVYSRYIPNLTRQDGSAFEGLLERSGLVQPFQVDFTA